MPKKLSRTALVQPVILCGGSGTRLWPASRKSMPKQFLSLLDEKSMLQNIAEHVGDKKQFKPAIFVTNEDFEFLIKRQLTEAKLTMGTFILEPEGRNTAPAIALAALSALNGNQDALLLVLPSDHVIGNPSAFNEMVQTGSTAAQEGALVTFGMTAHSPETGYGYIQKGKAFQHDSECFQVGSFKEKPSLDKAKEFVASGDYYWNSGMFLFSAKKYLAEIRKFEPEMYASCRAAYSNGKNGAGTLRPDPQEFCRSKSISIDYAVMERTSNAVVVAAEIGWSDIGSWPSFSDQKSSDDYGNVVQGDAILEDCKDTCIFGDTRLIAAIGLEDHVIIDTPDALLVAPKNRAQEVKAIVGSLQKKRRKEADNHKKVHRPWGTYEGLDLGEAHQVKHIVVYPGEKLSLQYHHHRSEHWVVVAGTAEVTVGDETSQLSANESVYIPVGAVHRLYNPGSVPVRLIEVQVGNYLGEDDIVRLEDVYGRVREKDTNPKQAI
ncbi:MAG: mannose-1-phosphate guanylyltransferase/mannose-6-phosphate isomerase [Sneathiella sp.]|uniref:mannose-1-phosphate guanylyltransferase/mannose-6-phosphate isomerase n=1 Tax=Sneathiella sp. TaxID=1964365 RepID=UPI0030014A80